MKIVNGIRFWSILSMTALTSCGFCGPTKLQAQEISIMQAVFAEHLLVDNAQHVAIRAAQLTDQDRYAALLEWVLPTDESRPIRFEGWFRANLDPPDEVASARPLGPTRTPHDRGWVRSPLLDLLTVAQRLDRTAQLTSLVSARSAVSEEAKRRRVAALALIAVAESNLEVAARHVESLYQLAEESQHRSVPSFWVEMTVGQIAIPQPPLHDVCVALLTRFEKLNARDRTLWDDRLSSLLSRLQYDQHQLMAVDAPMDAAEPWTLRPPLPTGWRSATLPSERLLREVRPESVWIHDNGSLRCWSSGGIDVLFFALPLVGQYAVEGDFDPTQTSGLMVNGGWHGANWTSSFHWSRRLQSVHHEQIHPAFIKFDSTASLRTSVDGKNLTYVNGRKIQERPVDSENAPWVAVRNRPGRHAELTNFRIEGNPRIPDSVALLDPGSFPNLWMGWAEYGPRWSLHGSSTTEPADQDTNADVSSEVRAERLLEFADCDVQSLFYYQRPMFEDGIIDYEFFYKPGETIVHPAIGRTAFVLSADGVQVHRINSTIDSSEMPHLDTADVAHRASGVDGSQSAGVPLQENAWNRLTLQLDGDTIRLTLNDRSVYEHRLTIAEQRNFGLFHFANRSNVRVRKMHWRGNWPKSLAEVSPRVLNAAPHPSVVTAEGLTEKWQHDFASAGLPSEKFRFSIVAPTQQLELTSQGPKITIRGDGRWRGTKVEVGEAVVGDFDVTLRYSEFSVDAGKGQAGIGISAVDDSGLEATVVREFNQDQQRVASKLMTPLPNGKRRTQITKQTDESAAGAIRLIRRGADVFMLASQDGSTRFRFIGQQELPSQLSSVTLRLIAFAQQMGRVTAVLNRIDVRVEAAGTRPTLDRRVLAVERYLRQLPMTKNSLKLGRVQPTEIALSAALQTMPVDGRLRMLIPSGTRSSVPGLTLLQSLIGDFDVKVSFDATELAAGSSAVMSLNTREGEFSVVATRHADATLTISSTEAKKTSTNSLIVESVDALRFIRIQSSLLILYSANGVDHILGQHDIDATTITSGGLRFGLLSDGRHRTSILWDRLYARCIAVP